MPGQSSCAEFQLQSATLFGHGLTPHEGPCASGYGSTMMLKPWEYVPSRVTKSATFVIGVNSSKFATCSVLSLGIVLTKMHQFAG